MQENTDWLINRENSIGNSKEIYVRGKKVSKVMEDDIKELRESYELHQCDWAKRCLDNIQKEYDKLKQENSMLRKVNKIVDSITPEDIERTLFEAGEDLKNNYIPKKVIKDKIQELDKLIIESQEECGSDSKEYTIYVYQKLILQELLEKE